MFSRFAQSVVNAFAQCACAASSCAENKTVRSMDAALSASIFLSILLLNSLLAASLLGLQLLPLLISLITLITLIILTAGIFRSATKSSLPCLNPQ